MPKMYLRRERAPDGARAATLILAPGTRFTLRGESEVKGAGPGRLWGILGALARLLRVHR